MQGTYFDILPRELIDIITCKLSVTLELYAYIEALKLDKPKIYYKLCIYVCDYLKDIPFDCKVGYSFISWERIYHKLACIIHPEYERILRCLRHGLVLGCSPTMYVGVSKISKRKLLGRINKCNELFLVILYKFRISKPDEQPRLSSILYKIIQNNDIESCDDIDPVISEVIDYRKSYVDVMLPTFKRIEEGKYMDTHGFEITTYDDSYKTDILSLNCNVDSYNGKCIKLTNVQRDQAEDLGYTLY